MEKFPETIGKIDKLIDKLEANTGGDINNKVNKLTVEQKQQQVIPKIQQTKKQANKTENDKSNQPQQKVQVKEQKKEEPKDEKNQKKKQKAQKKAKQVKQPKNKEEKQEKVTQQIGPKDFAQIDIRVGEIIECWKHPQSQNLYCQKIAVCNQVREIASGLQKFVQIDKMKGKVIVMANLKPRPLAGFNSNGMVVCASNSEHTAVELIIPDGQVGQRIYLQGFQDLFKSENILPLLNPKKKILEKCLQHFKTDEQGYVVWKGIRCRTKAAALKATIVNGGVS